MNDKHYRMYILVKDTVPDNYVPLMVGHAVANLIFTYYGWTDTIEQYSIAKRMNNWRYDSNMKKVICRVSEKEFQRAIIEAGYYIIQSETSGLDPDHLTDCVVAFVPRTNYPKFFKTFKLWKKRQSFLYLMVDSTLKAYRYIQSLVMRITA